MAKFIDTAKTTTLMLLIVLSATTFVTAPACSESQKEAPAPTQPSAQTIRLQRTNLQVAFNLEQQSATITATLHFNGQGIARLAYPQNSTIGAVVATQGQAKVAVPTSGELQVTAFSETSIITINYTAIFDDDPSAGEVAGQIHNFSVSAHVGKDGIFLSDNAGWHPIWIDPLTNKPGLIDYAVEIEPLDDWSIVASGNPLDSDPTERWYMPRPSDGIAIVGGKHVVQSRVHETDFGPVEIVMQTLPANEAQIPIFMDAAEQYLDLYTPILGPFPYKRFSIIENFFSSGFAYPGFTVLGPRVIPMGARALAPGYLDHEMIHNWWGNGVYVNQEDGNWCEALTTYCANYYRRILDADGDEEAGRKFRRGILMKLATDPAQYDNAPLDQFGINPEVDRFIGYDKGAFIFMMLEAPTTTSPDPAVNRARLFAALRDFFRTNQGRRAGWNELQTSIEKSFNASRADFFKTWVHEHTLPVVQPKLGMNARAALEEQISSDQRVNYITVTRAGQTFIDLDPDFYLYRLIPPSEIVPTIAGTTGLGGLTVAADVIEDEAIAPYLARLELTTDGENLIILGNIAAELNAALLARSSDPITFTANSFTVGGQTYDQPDHAILHTMQHPDRPGRFITIYLANSPAAWSHLGFIQFYSRDTTIIWQGQPVIERRTHEPSRLIPIS